VRHPDWALAYVLEDWRKRGRKTLNDAWEVARPLEIGDELDEARLRPLLDEAIRKMQVYVTALTEARDGSA
jgi:hypothetical protein